MGLAALIPGIIPGNVQLTVHLLSAAIAFFAGPLAAIMTYKLRVVPRYFQYTSVTVGIVSLAATFVQFLVPLGTLESSFIGAGGLELISVYPLVVWEILLGVLFMRSAQIVN